MTKELIYKYFKGECSDEEYTTVKEYLNGTDLTLLHEYMDEIASNTPDQGTINEEESFQLLASINRNINTEKIIKHIEQEIALDKIQKISLTRNDTTKRKLRWASSLRIAASITLIFTIGGGVYQIWKEREGKNIRNQLSTIWTTVNNSSMNVKQLTMPDGTSIWLNAHSSLAYRQTEYNHINREVRVNGEAFFDVTHNADKPFIVRSGNLTTTVLGTAFNVEAYRKEKDIRVILVRGKVSVQAGKVAQMLIPGQMLKYNKGNHTMAVKDIETTEINAWINGKLVFNDVSLQDAFHKIEQQYHIRITFSANYHLGNKRLTGIFDRKTPEDILNKILFIYGLKYHKKGGEYIINR